MSNENYYKEKGKQIEFEKLMLKSKIAECKKAECTANGLLVIIIIIGFMLWGALSSQGIV